MRARIRDTELYFDIDGTGLVPDGAGMREKPKAFVIHGGPGADHVVHKLGFSALAAQCQLIHFDHRGQGRSARGDQGKYTLHENVEDLEALREYLGGGPIVSIGTSYGGMVAMAHAARYPESVSHLILIVTAAHGGFIRRAKEIIAQRGTPEQVAQAEALFCGQINTQQKLQHYFEVMGPLYSIKHDAVAAALKRDRVILTHEALSQAFTPHQGLHTFDLRPELGSIAAPTLILAGRHDWICPPEFSEEIHDLIAGSDLRIFEHSSHSLLADETQNCLDAIAGFITIDLSVTDRRLERV